jgi:hypothetical protein
MHKAAAVHILEESSCSDVGRITDCVLNFVRVNSTLRNLRLGQR